MLHVSTSSYLSCPAILSCGSSAIDLPNTLHAISSYATAHHIVPPFISNQPAL